MANVRIDYSTIPTGITANSTTAGNYAQSFVNYTDFKTYRNVGKFATLEKNYWLLDGSFTNFPDSPTGIGYISTTQSNANGNFANPIVITRTYSDKYSTQGIVIQCDTHTHCYAKNINVKWYRDGSLIAEEDFVADDDNYLCNRAVSAFNKIVITITSTNIGNRFLKIFNIQDGTTITFIKDEIIGLDVLEELSTDSTSLSINTLDVSILSNRSRPLQLQRTLPMKLYRDENLIGCYFIDTYENDASTAKSIYKISANDYAGLLEYQTFLGGMYTNKNAGTLIAEILDNFPYEIDTTLASKSVSGWMGICTKRDAIKDVCFAIGGVIDTSRTDKIVISKLSNVVSSTIDDERIVDVSVKNKVITTDIQLSKHNYSINDAVEYIELYNQSLNGQAYVTFDSPYHSLTISGGSIVLSTANYAIIQGTGNNVILQGKEYVDSVVVETKRNPLAVTTDLQKIESYETTLTSNTDILAGNLQFIGATISATFKLESEKVGDLVEIKGMQGRIKSLEYAPNLSNLYATAELEELDG